MSTIREATRPTLPARPVAARAERRPFRDNPRLILLGILVLIAALVAMVRFADSSTELNPDFLTEVVLYALSAADLTMLVALVFVLARNIVKLVVERRRGLPFSRFRAKLVLAFLGLTIVPCVLVLIVGSELIRSSTEKWFSQPTNDVLSAATRIAQDYYHDRQMSVTGHASRIARDMPATAVESGDLDVVRRAIEAEVAQGRVGLVEVYRSRSKAGQGADVVLLLPPSRRSCRAATCVPRPIASPRSSPAAPAMRTRLSPSRAAAGSCAAARPYAMRRAVSSGSSWPAITCRVSRRRTPGRFIAAFQNRSQLLALRRPIRGVYLTLFVMMTLMILRQSTWTGLYLAKRITRPVQRLAAGAREIGAGHLDHRIEPETRDEFGSLVEAFDTMAGELAVSQRKLEHSRLDLERKNQQLDERRRDIETVLERIATGVVLTRPDGQIETINGATLRLLEVDRSSRRRARGRRLSARRSRASRRTARAGTWRQCDAGCAGSGASCARAASCTSPPPRRNSCATTGTAGGAVLVFDDVTPLIRTQRVAAWRDVARRLAHEIKNPLTPIQLCAERMRRQFATAPAPRARSSKSARRRLSGKSSRSRRSSTSSRSLPGVPAPRAAPADFERGADRDAGALQRSLSRDSHRASLGRRPAAVRASTSSRCDGSSSTWSTTPSKRSAERGECPPERRKHRSSSSRPVTTRKRAWRAYSSPTTVRDLGGRSRQAVHAVTDRPRGVGVRLGSLSSADHRRARREASKSRTMSPTGTCSRSSCRHDGGRTLDVLRVTKRTGGQELRRVCASRCVRVS